MIVSSPLTIPTQPQAAPQTQQNKTEKAAHDFEAMTINQMLQPMFESDDSSDNPFTGGAGEKQFKPMLIEQISHNMENNGGIGLSDALQKQMLTMQEHA
ncbi:rod-binding protein [Neokomagataea thailandica]|uniref:Chemotactic signal-response protein CheL n=1 Tax=Neokomagataea tanensis NBRC 106556 TaxID=1223519 RepID=A0ABQ0QIZ7_9PROT|nr:MULTISPECIES: rod-binding protein [Neokomagataea]GBR46540.1 chemotactic signal-response protein CheL [Neokomagataea tanensis NBRC 106556]